MSLSHNIESQELSHNKSDRTYFFMNFKYEVQEVFNEISRMSNVDNQILVNIMKGSIYLKGDYFIPLKSSNLFQLNSKELLEKLKEIPAVLSVEIDSNFNLILCLCRNVVYKAALMEVSNLSNSYGMLDLNSSILVLSDTEESKSFDNLRNTLLAEHIISILSANKMKIYYNECTSILKSASKLVCSDNCSLVNVCQRLEEEINTSEWKSDTHGEDNICLDANKYIICNGLIDKYGKAIEGIIISKNNAFEDLRKTCYIKHLIDDHMPEKPDYILHIASQGQNRNIYKSGVLLDMLENYHAVQVYVFNQSVQHKGNKSATADDFINEHKLEIEKAMSHKYEAFNPDDKTWAGRISSLTDTAVKFDYLKLNHCSILNLRSPSLREGEKSGVFVQYNFARLSNLFKNFDEKVDEGYYHPLSPLEDVDFSLLKLEEEWNLLHYVLSFPELVQSLVSSLLPKDGAKLRFRLNRVCVMLQELCQNLSLYYSRIRILSGPQPHLQKVMNARLWLLKGIHQVFKNAFVLLNVQGLDQM